MGGDRGIGVPQKLWFRVKYVYFFLGGGGAGCGEPKTSILCIWFHMVRAALILYQILFTHLSDCNAEYVYKNYVKVAFPVK